MLCVLHYIVHLKIKEKRIILKYDLDSQGTKLQI